jgi:predicted phosphodiesterase
MGKIMFVGDVHANRSYLIQTIQLARINGIHDIIQVGDLGWYPSYSQFPENVHIPDDVNFYWIDGNHEEHQAIQKGNLPSNMTYCPRGSSLEIHGKKFLFLGGAHSIDHLINPKGWSALENITEEDLERALGHEGVEVVVTHDAPMALDLDGMNLLFAKLNGFDLKSRGNREKLQVLLETIRPQMWFFGHWHYSKKYIEQDCEFYVIGGEQEIRHPRTLILDTETMIVEMLG